MTSSSSTEVSSSPIWHIQDADLVVEGLDAEGRPDPRYAASLGLLSAPMWRRTCAAAYDVIAFGVLQLPFWVGVWPLLRMFLSAEISGYGLVNHPRFVLACVLTGISVLLCTAFLLVQLFLQGLKGLSVGKAIARVRIVDVRTLERPGVGTVFLRFLIVAAFSLFLLLGPLLLFLSPLFDSSGRRRGWHDRATGVWLVEVHQGMNPYDVKRMRIARKLVKTAPTTKPAPLPSLATPVDVSSQREYQLMYQPKQRVSVAVLGVAKAYDHDDRPKVGFSEIAGEVELRIPKPGVPILGGYRQPDKIDLAAPTPEPQAFVPPAPPQLSPVVPASPPPASPPPVSPLPMTPPAMAPQQVAKPQPRPQPPKVSEGPELGLTQRFDAEPVEKTSLAAEPQRDSAVRMALQHKDGHRIAVDGIVLLGRKPDVGTSTDAEAVSLQDDTKTLSKTHLAVRPARDALEVVDLQSTNGSSIVRQGQRRPLAAGTPTLTRHGDVLMLGDLELLVVRQ